MPEVCHGALPRSSPSTDEHRSDTRAHGDRRRGDRRPAGCRPRCLRPRPVAPSGTSSRSARAPATGRSTRATASAAASSSPPAPGGPSAARAWPTTRRARQQIVVAERVLAKQGWGAWPACSRKLGLHGTPPNDQGRPAGDPGHAQEGHRHRHRRWAHGRGQARRHPREDRRGQRRGRRLGTAARAQPGPRQPEPHLGRPRHPPGLSRAHSAAVPGKPRSGRETS